MASVQKMTTNDMLDMLLYIVALFVWYMYMYTSTCTCICISVHVHVYQ